MLARRCHSQVCASILGVANVAVVRSVPVPVTPIHVSIERLYLYSSDARSCIFEHQFLYFRTPVSVFSNTSFCICVYGHRLETLLWHVPYIHPTQPETPQLRNCLQFVDATHDNWDVHFITVHESARNAPSSLYAAFSSLFSLPFTQLCAKWLLMHPPFWLLSFTPRGWDPCPCSLGKVHKVRAVRSRTHAL